MVLFDQVTKGVDANMVGKLKSVHDSFKGNATYESMLRDIATLDWEKADFQKVEEVAELVQ